MFQFVFEHVFTYSLAQIKDSGAIEVIDKQGNRQTDNKTNIRHTSFRQKDGQAGKNQSSLTTYQITNTTLR